MSHAKLSLSCKHPGWLCKKQVVVAVVVVDQSFKLFSTLEQTYWALAVCDSEWVTVAFYSAFFNIHQSGVLTALFCCYMAGSTWNCCRLSACSVYTIHQCTSLQCYFIPSHMCRVHVCLAWTCQLLFWQNNRIFYMLRWWHGSGMDIEVSYLLLWNSSS